MKRVKLRSRNVLGQVVGWCSGVIHELARRRVSTRSFRSRGVKFSAIAQILEAARQAPSGANKQPWRFIVINKPEMKKTVRAVCEEAEREYHKRAPQWMKRWMRKRNIEPIKPFLTEAPYLILVCSDAMAPYHIQSTWISIGFVLLAAEEMGLGTLTYTPSETSALRRILKIPERYSLEAILPIGFPSERKRKRRRSLKELIYVNTWEETLLTPDRPTDQQSIQEQ